MAESTSTKRACFPLAWHRLGMRDPRTKPCAVRFLQPPTAKRCTCHSGIANERAVPTTTSQITATAERLVVVMSTMLILVLPVLVTMMG